MESLEFVDWGELAGSERGALEGEEDVPRGFPGLKPGFFHRDTGEEGDGYLGGRSGEAAVPWSMAAMVAGARRRRERRPASTGDRPRLQQDWDSREGGE